ncbi:hypothetical protein KP509_27G064500 [Ceratopteris richardii]|uniref:Uncharacterized protein n=1 Tax=Ceratopteris richardii TaxID=49495 RepID=A0A8T2RJL9_CERRI|nr:hypothetical protein KP509_27G064500 [Ceratopteris richardii]
MAERPIQVKDATTAFQQLKQQPEVLMYDSSNATATLIKPSQLSPLKAASSTPSPTHPFIYLDSTSTASLSHLLPPSHTSSQNGQRKSSRRTSASSDSSSLSPERSPSKPQEVVVGSVFPKSVSIEQHLQRNHAGRDESMQDFILQRFLPAAKAVAEDHDCTAYSPGKHHLSPMSSTTSRSSFRKAIPKADYVHEKKNTSSPTSAGVSKTVTWSPRLSSNEEGDSESVEHVASTKNCGIFRVGLKTAASRVNNLVNSSAHALSKSKSSGGTASSSHETSSDEDDIIPKVKVLSESSRKQRFNSLSVPSSSSPTTTATLDTIQKRASSLKKDPGQTHLIHSKNAYSALDSSPMFSQCVASPSNCQINELQANAITMQGSSLSVPSSSSPTTTATLDTIQKRASSLKKDPGQTHLIHSKNAYSALDSSPMFSQCVASPSNCQINELQANAITMQGSSCHDTDNCKSALQGSSYHDFVNCDNVSSGSSLNNHFSQNGDDFEASKRASPCPGPIKEGCLRQATTKDTFKSPSEDENIEFFDALSRFDTLGSPRSNVTSQENGSTKSHNDTKSPLKQNVGEHDLIQTHPACIGRVENSGSNVYFKDNEVVPCKGHSEGSTKGGSMTPAPVVLQKRTKKYPQDGKDGHRMGNPSTQKTPSSSSVLGWPLGITSFQQGAGLAHKQVMKEGTNGDSSNIHVGSAKAQTEGQGNSDRRNFNDNLNIQYTSKTSSEKVTKAFGKCDVNTSFLMNGLDPALPLKVSIGVSSPPVPPAPRGSWLGKALALKESKPASLVTLQAEERVLPVKKKVGFTLTGGEKKEVKWEDVVKGSHMHPEKFSFTENRHHHHPANQNPLKPLTL